MSLRSAGRLMYVTDQASSRFDVRDVALAAADGGADCVQVRGEATDRALFELAETIVKAVGDRMLVLVNGRFDIAWGAGAHGVHLKDDGLSPALVRRALGEAGAPPSFRVGISVHDQAGLRKAAREGADHVTLGPLHQAHGRTGLGTARIQSWIESARLAGELPRTIFLLGGAGEADASWARSREGSDLRMGLAGIRAFQDAPTLAEVTSRARILAELLSGEGSTSSRSSDLSPGYHSA